MKRFILTTLLTLGTLAGFAQQEGDLIKVGDTMPAFTIVSDNGAEFKSSALQGKVVLLTFFATWCGPCQKELAAVQEQLWPKYRDNAKFTMLVIGREHTDAELKTYNETKGFDFPLYPDKSKAIYSLFASKFIPRTYLVDKNGKVIFASTGFNEAEFAGLMDKIEGALK